MKCAADLLVEHWDRFRRERLRYAVEHGEDLSPGARGRQFIRD